MLLDRLSHTMEVIQRRMKKVWAVAFVLFINSCLRVGRTHILLAESDCGGYLIAGNGYFDSPNFPEEYPPNLDCTWTIKTSIPNSRINLTSDFFFLEFHEHCLWDRVTLKDGNQNDIEVPEYCGNKPLQYVSQHDILHVRFHSDISNGDVGFRIRYMEIPSDTATELPECNVTLADTSGIISSPRHPARYPPFSTCTYLIQAPLDHRIELEFENFDLEGSPCTYDFVTVYDGSDTNSRVMGTFCGHELPPYLLSTNEDMLVVFKADDRVQLTGFNATYRLIAPPTTQTTLTKPPAFEGEKDCYQVLTSRQGNFTSPGFPDFYPNDKHCVTILRAHVPSSFVLEFSFFDLEEGDNCSYDSLAVYVVGDPHSNATDVDTENPTILCNKGLESKVLTMQGLQVKMVFSSDLSVNGGGYSGTFFIAPIDAEGGCSTPCENGGSCAREALPDGSFQWRCECIEGFKGLLCEDEVETCSQVTCLNGGICRPDSHSESVVCDCLPGFEGSHCGNVIPISEEKEVVFTKVPVNVSAIEGGNVLLECAVSDPTVDVMWLFRDRMLTESDRRTSVEVHPGGVVYIAEVGEQHEGRYTCMAVTATDLLERSVWVTIKEPCMLNVEKAPQNMTVREGETIVFQCLVPAAEVTMWRKDGEVVKQGLRKRMLVNNYLMITGVVETDAGEYTCAARDKNGCFAKVSAYLRVNIVGHDKNCGKPSVDAFEGRSYRISSGREAPEGTAPWHVIIRETVHKSTFCGGSLLNERWLVTAAHCVFEFEEMYNYPFHPDNIELILGTRHCMGEGGIKRKLKQYILHPDFEGSNFNNDIALFELDEPLRFSEEILPICLERAVFIDELLQRGRLGVVTGCGTMSEGGRAPKYLNEVKLPYVPREVCAERAQVVNASFTPGMLCAGYSRSMRGDACAGDSGGPYVMEYSGRFVLAGIVSWGVGCDRENQYGYYTHVSRYYDWIVKNTNMGLNVD